MKKGESYEDLANRLKLEDHGGILKCKGWLDNSDLDLEAQQPIILAKDHHFTKLINKEWRTQVSVLGVKESTSCEERSERMCNVQEGTR